MKKQLLFIVILMLGGLNLYAFPSAATGLPTEKRTEFKTTQTEEEKVTHLINYIRTLNGAVFIRNGKEFSPAEAADHLHSKWDKHKKKVKTARGFVTQLATESKTHEPYLIRFSDGRKVKCGDLLSEELKKIEG